MPPIEWAAPAGAVRYRVDLKLRMRGEAYSPNCVIETRDPRVDFTPDLFLT